MSGTMRSAPEPRMSMNGSHMVHARQFIIGPSAVAATNLTVNETLGPSWQIARHADLPAAFASAGDRELLCLGELLDPHNPRRSNAEVLQSLLKVTHDFAQFEAASAGLAGRWIVVARLGGMLRLYPDATGLKSVFYLREASGRVWAASQPGIFVEALGIQQDEEIRAKFAAHSQSATSWPCEVTPYVGVRQLLPNHYLDLHTGTAHRFWPTAAIQPRSLDDAAAEIAQLLHGAIAAIVARGTAALPLTAGYDSRTLFACAGELRASIPLFRVQGHHLPWYDTAIPRKLVRQYGLAIREIKPRRYDQESWQIMQRNISHLWWDPGDYMVRTFATLNVKYILLGLLSEIGRCFYYRDGQHPQEVTGRSLAATAFYRDHPLAIEAFERWLAGVPRHAAPAVLDLLYWEHRAGNWASMMATAYDAFVEPAAPYNCRALLTTMLGVDLAHRREPYELHRRICAVAAPETLRYPFNFSWRDAIQDSVVSMTPWRIRVAVSRLRKRIAGFDLSY
jgi:hypothetical protein